MGLSGNPSKIFPARFHVLNLGGLGGLSVQSLGGLPVQSFNKKNIFQK